VTATALAIVDEARRESPALLRLARRHSLCAADAEDALQRAFEILLRRVERVRPATALPWLRTVVSNCSTVVRSGPRRRSCSQAATRS
jgi:DNA-directed RNA polymerase specialized sigma24 family protein